MLTSSDGSFEISGTLLGFNGEFHRFEVVYGELTVDVPGVFCDGTRVPQSDQLYCQGAGVGQCQLGGGAGPSTNRGVLDLSRFCAAPSALLSHLAFESDGAFPTQC